MEDPLISIAMPTFNSAWALPRVLESILLFDYDLKRIRLVFVDNCSTDGSESVLRDFASEKGSCFESVVIERARTNIPVARNICFDRSAGCDYIFILDSDVITPPDTLKVLLKDFASFQNVGIASFPWDHTNAKKRARSLYDAFEVPDVYGNAYKVGNGCNLISMEAFKVVGYFNPKLNVHEDGEYCYRLKKKGFNIVCDFSHEGKHLKSVPTPPKYYLKFMWSSSNTYIEMLKRGSKMHALKFLTTVIMILCAVLSLVYLNPLPLLLFVPALIVAFWVNTSKIILDDGISIRASYLPIVAPLMSAITAIIVCLSLGRLLVRGLRSIVSRSTEKEKTMDPQQTREIKATFS